MSEKQKPKLINIKLVAIMQQIDVVKKTSNDRYKTMKIWDIINMLHPLMKKQDLIMTKEIISSEIRIVNEKILAQVHIKFRLQAVDDSFIETESAGMGYNAAGKELNQAQQYALKYAMMHMFMIPDNIDEVKK